ncbi:MAG: sarcosine oxidase subunit alpha family protein [Methylobacteriaceae bacterium]|nr:sarcosine oxidase subunit alpha family protein [Methylobacteriaceae bacterium]
MSEPFRIATGGDVKAGAPLTFMFDGVSYAGRAGDTLASALLAHGVHLVGRSYKYHRPRGVLSAGAEEPNALVGVDGGAGRFTPNLRATQVELHDGLVATSQNRWPSLAFDLGAVNSLGARFFSAGFYYKTFMGPRAAGLRAWKNVFEPIVRQAAGLGAAPTAPDPDRYAQFYTHCDALIVGAGAAGLAAALAAGRAGADVILCDEQARFGGSLLQERTATIDDAPASAWLEAALAALAAMPNVRMVARTQAFGHHAQNLVGLCERVGDRDSAASEGVRERLWQVRARDVVLATGAIERPLVFPGNDRPGVMLAEAARAYLARWGVAVGRRVLVATTHDSAYRVALDLRAAGVGVAGVVDLRDAPTGELVEAARGAGIRVLAGRAIKSTSGRLRIREARIGPVASTEAAQEERIACDALLMCGGWTPSVHLHAQSRGKLVWAPAIGAFVPGQAAAHVRSAGACNGAFGLAAALREGDAAGAAVAGGSARAYATAHDPPQTGARDIAPARSAAAKDKAFLDFQNDVAVEDVELAVREGMRSIEHVKRYTTTGMATDQGKTSNLNALEVAARALGKAVPEVGLTTYRSPYTPVTFGALAGASRGDLFDPVRRTPIDPWAQAQGAAFEDVGLWKRAHYFPRAGESMAQAVARECRQTRASVGLFDASTLGKIEVVGPDAAAFLEKMYTNPFAGLAPGRCRYALMLNEAGFVIDDGVVARLAPDRFHVTTTTGGAARVLHHMEDYLQTEFPQMKVWLTSTSEQWAVIAVQGPRARDVITPLVEEIDLSREATPHMSVREGRVCGFAARVMRVSFTGELGFEINVPSEHGRAVWEAVWAEGASREAVAYGTEAMHVMRAEKGYVIVGQDTDGTVTPDDLGLGWAIGKNKRDFVGKRSLARPDIVAAGRKQFVGLLTEDPAFVAEEGAQIVDARGGAGGAALGHVTSAYFSPALGRSIALALVANGRNRIGETLHIPIMGRTIAARVVAPTFHDPQGALLDV